MPSARLHFLHHFVGPGVDQVDLVEHRHDRQVAVHGREGVGHRLGLDPLAGVDQQQAPSQQARLRETS